MKTENNKMIIKKKIYPFNLDEKVNFQCPNCKKIKEWYDSAICPYCKFDEREGDYGI